jgi:cell division protein FtsZ
MAVTSPLMETSINGAKGILVSIVGSPDMGLEEVEVAMGLVEAAAHPDANIIFGASFDENMEDEIRVIVIATCFDGEGAGQLPRQEKPSEAKPQAPSAPAAKPKDDFDDILKIFN